MKKYLLSVIFVSCIATKIFSQATDNTQITDEQIIAIAHERGIAEVDIPGFINYYRNGGNTTTTSTQRNVQPAAPLFIVNSGFETGDFTSWTGAIGDNTVNSGGPLQNIQPGIFSTTMNAAVSDLNARHTIMTSVSGNDPSGAFPIVPPFAGIYTARMGTTVAQYQGEILEQTFVVDATQSYIKINYAVVLNDGGHLAGESPYFTYALTDSAGNNIVLRHDEMVNSPAGYIQSLSTASTYYLPWQTDSISLVNYIGHMVKVSFTVAGCIYSGHFGYCYVDIYDPANLQSVNEANTNLFQLYPNPSNGIFNVAMNENFTGNEKIVVADMLGQIVNPALTKTSAGYQIDMSNENSGMYFVTVSTASEVSTQRIVVN